MSWPNCSRRGLLAAGTLAGLGLGCSEEARPLLQVGQKMLPFSLDLIGGGTRRAEDHLGKPLVITFMSSWCPCSNRSLPLLNQAYLHHGSDRVAFLMIGIQDSRSKFEAFVRTKGVVFPAGFDKGDRIARDYGVATPPTTFFVGRDGIVKRAIYGSVADRPGELRQWLEEIL